MANMKNTMGQSRATVGVTKPSKKRVPKPSGTTLANEPAAAPEAKKAGCAAPSIDCPRERRWSGKMGRWMWFCDCGKAFPENTDGTPSNVPLRGDPNPDVKCPLCGSAMCLVSGSRNGDFWSCSKHPKCKGTTEVTKESAA